MVVCPHVRKSDVRSAFKAWDKEQVGFLCKHQLKCAMLSLFGRKPSKVTDFLDACTVYKEEVQAILEASFDGVVDQAMFERLMLDRVHFVVPEEHFRSAFQSFCSRKGQAAITQEAFLSVLTKHAPHLRHHIARQAWMQLRLDQQGCLTYTSFVAAMTAG